MDYQTGVFIGLVSTNGHCLEVVFEEWPHKSTQAHLQEVSPRRKAQGVVPVRELICRGRGPVAPTPSCPSDARADPGQAPVPGLYYDNSHYSHRYNDNA